MTTQKLDSNEVNRVSRAPKKIEDEILCNFYYDETSPSCLRWANSPSPFLSIRRGDIAGSKTKAGYWTVKSCGRTYKVHRIVYALHHKEWDQSSIIDHKDRDKSNNKQINLRELPPRFNSQNTSLSTSNKSGVTGVGLQYGHGDYWSWVASARRVDGTYWRKTFGVPKYGNDLAFHLACEERKQMIEYLNKNGMQYSETHGK